jgi:hypothetical protein
LCTVNVLALVEHRQAAFMPSASIHEGNQLYIQ